ncbi:MAG TPA: TetR family transcriptional regulator [Solirubrobacteraceae bacterium]|jgi:AcrR family transcriptional regulator|nr:TetR family transcriptional regulator [Solirubrobacteraceae bacterium]
MTSVADKHSSSPSRRAHDAEASRRALLDAARALFDERGYDRATTREIGQRASVDAALIARYFGGKEGLYIATIAEEPAGSWAENLDANSLVSLLLKRWEYNGHSPISRALVSATLTDAVREQIHAVTARRLVNPLSTHLAESEVPEPELRAELLVALTLGVAVTRSNRTLERLSAASLDQLLVALEPLIQALQSA